MRLDYVKIHSSRHFHWGKHVKSEIIIKWIMLLKNSISFWINEKE